VNHDALFKALLKRPAILRGFFNQFLPQVAHFVDFAYVEFVDKEHVTVDGRKRTGDLLVKTRFQGKSTGFLIHLEHQAQPYSDLARRMLEYWLLDWRDYSLPVYPIAVLSHRQSVKDIFSPLEIRFPNKCVMQFDFDVIDLSRMNAESYVQTTNPAALALAARMKKNPKARVSLSRDFFLSLAAAKLQGMDQQLVLDFFSKYQRLNDQEALQLHRELGKVKTDSAREAAMNLTNPFIRLGMHQGFHQGQAEMVLRLLSRRLGKLSSSQGKSIRKLPTDKIEALGEALLDFTSIADLRRWMKENVERGT
jgi:hypothetical protein